MNKLKNIDDELLEEFSSLPEDFWDFKNDDTKELTHSIHNYPAVMVYPISRNILKIVNKYRHSSTLLDPFMGSGTVLLEGLLSGCSDVYGNDLNPLAHKISKAKTTILNYDLDKSFNDFSNELEHKYALNNRLLNEIDYFISDHHIDITARVNDKNNWGANAYNILNTYLSILNSPFLLLETSLVVSEKATI